MQIRIPEERAQQARRLSQVVLREPFQKRCWVELGYFLLASALAAGAVLVLGAIGFVGLLLTIVLVGVFILGGGLRVARGLGRWQRSLAWTTLGENITEPEPFSPAPGIFRWLRAALGDGVAWRSVLYFVTKVPLTIFGVWFALSLWIEAALGIASPFLGDGGTTRFGLIGHAVGRDGSPSGPPTFSTHVTEFVIGILFLFIAPWAMRFVVYVDRRLMHLLLGPNATSSRVRSLEDSRTKTLDAATETLQRIERNLHDGTQAQLVALAMRLGQAKERLEGIEIGADEADDLEVVRRLVDEAHRGAKEAITDLRDLARGIHPPALDTGLENALATLAARSTIPTDVQVSVHSRPSPAVEAISYFCAAELLANVAQHADASRASLSCTQHGPWLRIVVRDDGSGGATVNRIGSSSSGLAGLADRVGAVDGHLSIASPSGWTDRSHRGPADPRVTVPDVDAIRVVIAEDSAILRDGLHQLLSDRGFAVVRAVVDAVGLEQAFAEDPPDVAVVDIRMPPTFTDEGLRSAIRLRSEHPDVGILVFSQYVETRYAAELLAGGAAGIGYLLKDRVADVADFVEALVRVASGGTALDPEVVTQLMGARGARMHFPGSVSVSGRFSS